MLLRLSPSRLSLPAVLLIAVFIPTARAQPGIALSRIIPNRFIVSYAEGAAPSTDHLAALLPDASLLAWYPHLGVGILQLADPANSDAYTQQLTREPGVLSVTQDRIVSAYAVAVRTRSNGSNIPDASPGSEQGWAVRAVGGFGASAGGTSTPGPWDITQGAGVRIAILDSGIDATHPDLAPNLALNLSEIDQNPQTGIPSPCDDGSAQDQQGHGTWTASLAAGTLHFGTALTAGVAPAATLLNIKVLERLPTANVSVSDPIGCSAGQASGLLSWVLHGIEDAIVAHADIISMSFGMLVDPTTPDGAPTHLLLNHVAHLATQAGIILIAAAGNDGLDLSSTNLAELPAEASDVLAIVASTNPACAQSLTPGAACAPGPVTLPYYSNFGAPLDALAAPGGSYPASADTSDTNAASGWITAACSSGEPDTLSGPPTDSAHSFGCFGLGHIAYVQAMGTSASAALAAGAAALLRAAHPDWNPAAIIQALRSSAVASRGLLPPQINVASLITCILERRVPHPFAVSPR